MPFFPSVTVPLLCEEKIKPPPACPLVRTVELMTCPGWGVPCCSQKLPQAPGSLPVCLVLRAVGAATRYSFLAVKRWVSLSSGLKETVRLGNFFYKSGQNHKYIFYTRSSKQMPYTSSVTSTYITCMDKCLQFLRVSDSLRKGDPEFGSLPSWCPSESSTDVTGNTVSSSQVLHHKDLRFFEGPRKYWRPEKNISAPSTLVSYMRILFDEMGSF